MTISLSITESATIKVLGDFLASILPAGVAIVRGQENRVAEPSSLDFVSIVPILRERLTTNIDGSADALFEGSIADNVLNITTVEYGALVVGSLLFGTGLADGTVIAALRTGTGGAGTYTVSPGGQTVGSVAIAAGVKTVMQETKVTMQLDVHGPNSGDNAQIISTLLRDEYAVGFFDSSGVDAEPLYVGEPRQLPFENDQQQIEFRWVIDAVLQANPVASVPQQFADVLAVDLINVDVVYPPA